MNAAGQPTIAALIVAAGTGARFGGSIPKQYQPLLGRPVLRWCLDSFIARIEQVYVAIHPDHQELYRNAAHGLSLPPPFTGGKTRQETVLLALEQIAKKSKPDFILIHDAARPGVDDVLLSRICQTLDVGGGVVPGLPVADTLRRKDGGTESRDGLYTIQTPQAFPFQMILDLHRRFRDTPVTDDASLCDLAGMPVLIVEGMRRNIKITQEEDLVFMEQALSMERGDIRTGQGYDVHRLVPPQAPGRKMKLGGIEFAHDKVLEGHSDADVALHSITDALFAALCDGDIGEHFSPKDFRWKEADSAAFLKDAADRIAAAGGIISHIDLTVVCEEPKISPQREKMRRRIAEIVSLPLSRVSVKATTTEGLGFTGRREGIAAQAIATIRLPFGPQRPAANFPLLKESNG